MSLEEDHINGRSEKRKHRWGRGMRGGRSTLEIGLSKFTEEREPNGEQAGGGKAGPAWRGLAEFDEGLEEEGGAGASVGRRLD